MPVLYAKSLEDLLSIVNDHEIKSCTRFVRRLPSDFTSPIDGCESLKGKRILYLEGGSPGLKLGSTSFVCQYGPDARKKKKDGADSSKNEDVNTSRVSSQTSHKLNCPAKITIWRQVIFLSFATSMRYVSGRARNKKVARSQLLSCISTALNEGKVTFQVRYVITLPADEEHVPKHAGKDYDGYQPLDERLRHKVKELVSQHHITEVKTVQKHLEKFVVEELYKDCQPPPKTNQRFYPDLKILRNCVDVVISSTQFVPKAGDQNSLDEVLHQLPPNHRWKLPDSEANSRLLFVHQTVEQAELMVQYGGEMCELNATHRTTRYVFPMYFIIVKVDSTYQVVGTFIVPQETTECIREGLQVIADWNPSWSPQYWMAGHSSVEISAIEAVFKDSQVFICDFHRLEVWRKWMAAAANAIPKESALTLTIHLKEIADSSNVDELNGKIEALCKRCEWTNHTNLQDYMTHTWFNEDIMKRWVKLYRTDRVLKYVRMGDDVERMNKLMRAAIRGGRCPSLSLMVPRLLNWISDFHTKRLHPKKKSRKAAIKSSPLDAPLSYLQDDGGLDILPNSPESWSSLLNESCPVVEIGSQTVCCKSGLASSNSTDSKLNKLRQLLSDIRDWSFLPMSESHADTVLKKLSEIKAKIDSFGGGKKNIGCLSPSQSTVTAKRKKLPMLVKSLPNKKSKKCQ